MSCELQSPTIRKIFDTERDWTGSSRQSGTRAQALSMSSAAGSSVAAMLPDLAVVTSVCAGNAYMLYEWWHEDKEVPLFLLKRIFFVLCSHFCTFVVR